MNAMTSAQVLTQSVPAGSTQTKINKLDVLMHALVVLGAVEFVAFILNFAAHPAMAGVAGQPPAFRFFLGFIWGPMMLLTGALLQWRAPGNVASRFTILVGVAAIGGQLTFDLGSPERTSLVFELFIVFGAGIVAPTLGYLMFTFPTGQVYPPKARPWLWAYAVVKFLGVALAIMASGRLIRVFSLPVNPLFVPALAPFEPVIAATVGIAGAMLPMGLMAGMISLVLRYRASPQPVRVQIKWVMWGLGTLLTSLLTTIGMLFVFGYQLDERRFAVAAVVGTLAQAVFVVSLVAAVTRHHLFDIRVLINRTLLYGALTAIVVAIYVVVVGVLSVVLENSGNFVVALLATGVVALLFQPLRERLQRAVNRLIYGERDEPYRVLSRLSQRLEATLAPDATLATIVETVGQALKLPYAAIQLQSSEERAMSAEWMTQSPATNPQGSTLVRLPLIYQGEAIGQLVVAPRIEGDSSTPAERRLLEDIAHQAGAAAYAVQLTTDLQRSRERLVTAREEERRRLRRDLHDGLGSTLTGVRLKIGAALNQLEPDSPATAPLAEAKTQIQRAIADIRRLVYDLRPPALDELGLIEAIRQQAEQFGFQVEAPDRLPTLSAAVEVAAYRIALEAMNNAAKHAQAKQCVVKLSSCQVEELQSENASPDNPATDQPNNLTVAVCDDGIGISPDAQTGVGLRSMRERTEELGGKVTIESQPSQGTRVIARLPI